MTYLSLQLKKGEDRRLRTGHPWIFSNEINTTATPLKSFTKGQVVKVIAHDQSAIGLAYINPHSLIAARLLTTDLNESINADFFKKRLIAALSLRETLFSVPYYRLVFSEADELPGLVIDRFGDHLVVQINTAGMELNKALIQEALLSLLPNTQSILLRNDSAIRSQEGLAQEIMPLFGTPPDIVTLEENGVFFEAPIKEGQKTGWFYDHRDNRSQQKRFVKDKSVLDVFSYLGSFGIQAATFGAKSVTCIESSALASSFIQKNAKRNQVSEKITIETNDAFDAMKALIKANKQFDLITLDPPAFVKKAKDLKEGLIAYQRINELALKLLAENGILITCSCSMQVSLDELRLLLKRAANRVGSVIQIIGLGHQGPDHPIHPAIPESEYLKAIFVRKIR